MENAAPYTTSGNMEITEASVKGLSTEKRVHAWYSEGEKMLWYKARIS